MLLRAVQVLATALGGGGGRVRGAGRGAALLAFEVTARQRRKRPERRQRCRTDRLHCIYFVVPLLEPLLWPLVLPEAPLELEPLGAGVGVLLLPELLLWPLELPDAPLEDEPLDEGVELELPLAPELPFAPKWASHSERDTLPSLFVSTDEKLGADEDAPAPALPLMPELELWPEVLPPEAAEPLEDDGLLVLPLLLEGDCAEVEPLLDLSPAAKDAPDSARSAAAVALTRTFTFM